MKTSLHDRLARVAASEEVERRKPGAWLLRSPEWATALALHLLAAVVLMNIVEFTARPGASVVFRIGLSPSRPGPPGGAEQGTQDNGVNGKDSEDGAPAGPVDAAVARPGGVKLPPIQAPAGSLQLPAGTNGLVVSGLNGLGGLFQGRGGAGRGEALRRYGGDDASEKAVADGLEWLAKHQEQDGSWDPGKRCPKCGDVQIVSTYRGACSGLALLAFLGAGHLPGDAASPYGDVVKKGVDWLVTNQNKYGAVDPTGSGCMYTEGICAYALCEAFAMTQEPTLRPHAQSAVAFTVASQQACGGWDYSAYTSGRGDSSITSWHVMVLRSARAARLAVPESAWNRAIAFVTKAADSSGNVAYDLTGPAEHAIRRPGCNMMTAAGLATRLYLGVHDDPILTSKFLATFERVPPRGDGEAGQCPNWGSGGEFATCKHWSLYYTYYATLACFHSGGTAWDKWNPLMRAATIPKQSRSGHWKGSWEPVTWDARAAGRIYATAFNVMNLEVYYRYLPCSAAGAEEALGPLMGENEWRALAARFPALKPDWRNSGPGPDGKTTAELLEQLKSDDMMARRDAARRLEGAGDESVTAAIVEAAKAEKTSLRSILDESLGRMAKTEASLDYLVSELRSETAANRKAALVALRKLTGQWFGDDASKWEAWRKSGGQ